MDNEKDMQGKKNAWFFLLLFFAFTTASIVLSVLCIHNTRHLFLKDRATIFTVLCAILLFVACGVCVWCVLAGRDRLVKGFISAYLFVIFSFAYILPLIIHIPNIIILIA